MSTADDELQRACGSVGDYARSVSPEDVLDVLGRIGPVTAWVLALREHRKRVENDTGSPLPDQSQWAPPEVPTGSTSSASQSWAWKDNNHVG